MPANKNAIFLPRYVRVNYYHWLEICGSSFYSHINCCKVTSFIVCCVELTLGEITLLETNKI